MGYRKQIAVNNERVCVTSVGLILGWCRRGGRYTGGFHGHIVKGFKLGIQAGVATGK